MKIIELYGYSCSGKTYLANKIKSKNRLDISFLKISKSNRFLRIIIKISYIFSIKYSDFIFILNLHKNFKFIKLKFQLKNFFSFLYLIGFIRYNLKKKNSVIIDHGIFQCLFSCYIFSFRNYNNDKNISEILKKFFSNFPINFRYEIICMQTKIEIITSRLIKNKNFTNYFFLKKNKIKINKTYKILQNVSKNISNKYLKFKFIKT